MRILIIIFMTLLLIALGVSANAAQDPRYCGSPKRDSNNVILRNHAELYKFRIIHQCPSTGNYKGACPDWSIDHVIPLACGGCDIIVNMQWLPNSIKISGAYAKDKFERKIYAVKPELAGTESCVDKIVK